MTVHDIAQDAVRRAKLDPAPALDPATLLVLVELVAQVLGAAVKLFQGCHQTPAQAVAHLRATPVVARWVLRVQFGRALPPAYATYRPALLDGTVAALAARTDAELAAAYAAAPN